MSWLIKQTICRRENRRVLWQARHVAMIVPEKRPPNPQIQKPLGVCKIINTIQTYYLPL
jgi:hypothetical protein